MTDGEGGGDVKEPTLWNVWVPKQKKKYVRKKPITEPIEWPTEEVRKVMRAMGRVGGGKGGIARDRLMSPERKSEIGRMGAEAKWAKYRKSSAG